MKVSCHIVILRIILEPSINYFPLFFSSLNAVRLPSGLCRREIILILPALIGKQKEPLVVCGRFKEL